MKSDISKYRQIFKQEGTARTERFTAALNPANLAVDDRKLEDFIVYAQRYTKNVLFVPSNGQVDLRQTWNHFFRDNAALLMANIATRDVTGLMSAFEALRDKCKAQPDLTQLRSLAEYVFGRYKLIDEWYFSAAEESSLNRDIRMYVKSSLGRPMKQLAEVFAYLHTLEDASTIVLPPIEQLYNKDDIWSLAEHSSTAPDNPFSGDKTAIENAHQVLFSLEKTFDLVWNVTTRIVSNCSGYFNSSVFEQQNHPPHIALFIAFTQLYGYAQQDLNRLPQRLLDFYYREALQVHSKIAIPDRTFILFQIAKGFDNFLVRGGTRLAAGKDKTGKEITYTTDKDLLLNRASIAAVKRIIMPKEGTRITNYYASSLRFDMSALGKYGSWKPFVKGEDELPATVGLAISSTQFYLAKAERKVWVLFETLEDVVFERLDPSLLVLRLTGEKNWISSLRVEDAITIRHFKKVESKKIELYFSIGIAQTSAILAFNPAIHVGNYATDKPVLELLLRFPEDLRSLTADANSSYEDQISNINALQFVRLSGVQIKVQVGSLGQKASFDGVQDLRLENHESVLDAKKPFMPFTAVPQVGSSFYIGCNDLYYKPIQTLKLSLEWMLPDNYRAYYDKYFPPYDTNKFTASLSVLQDQHWTKLFDVSVIDAFAKEPKFKSLVFNPLAEQQLSKSNEKAEDVLNYDITKQDGTLKLMLNFPDFGHSIYAQLITATVMEKASSKLAMVDYKKIVKKQLHDSVITIKYPEEKSEFWRVIDNVLQFVRDDEQAIGTMLSDLERELKSINGSNVTFSDIQQTSGNIEALGGNTTIVNDNNFLERIMRFLRKLKLIDKNVHFDEDKDNVTSIVEDIGDRLDSKVDFMLPGDQELVVLIIGETNNAIGKVVMKIAEQLVTIRKTNIPEGKVIAEIVRKEIDDANEVINDLIARKIAVVLAAHDVPPKPYTPLINSLAVSYVSTKGMTPTEDEFFHILPFGNKAIIPFSQSLGSKVIENELLQPTLFPGYLINSDVSHPGLLALGIRDIQPTQNLALFFRMQEVSRISNKKPPGLNWWYLRASEWIPLSNDLLLSDGTNGLQNTGIVEITMPGDVDDVSSIFQESGLYWLAVSVDENMDAFPNLVQVETQAVQVTFYDEKNEAGHLSAALPAGSITRMADKGPGVKSVTQPVASRNGRMQEDGSDYYTRVSERMRHKNRALNSWDYERLVLEAFPFVYKVKCLNNYNAGLLAIGHITLVPILDLTNKDKEFEDERIPIASYSQLLSIERFVSLRSSVFVKVHAISPRLDYVRVCCKVKFNIGVDKGRHLQQLNLDVIRYLTPWSTGDHETLSFSTKIYASSIIDFIGKKPYVDYVTELYLHQYTLQDNKIIYCKSASQNTALAETEFTSAHSLLVSATSHEIQLL
jgi:hypothetical protein